MNLGGLWRVAESAEDLHRDVADPALDDSGWATHEVPGHWRSVPGLSESDGPVLYRRWFAADPPEDDGRAFLVFEGIFYQSDVWLDGDYLGDTEGYFFPHTFEITEALRRPDEHLLAVEVHCSPPADRRAKRNLTGVFQHWDCIDATWNPGGIWAPVRIERTGPVHIESLKVLCPEAGAERAVLDLEAVLDTPQPGPVRLATTVGPEAGGPVVDDEQDQMLSAGANVVRWRVAVERPQLWWPRALGAQPLYRVEVTVGPPDGPVGDRRSLVTGLRQIRVRNFIATVNGERLYLKGTNCGPTRRDPASATAAEVAADVDLAAGAGLDLLRVHAHVGRPELYEAADRTGMLIWQDLPLQWGYGNVRRQAVKQAGKAVDLLGHHPSIAVWCGHNEPMAVDPQPGAALAVGTAARAVAAQVLPTWNKTGLDRSIRRALERADRSRTVVAHSGVLPHPLWGTDSHLYYGWYHGHERDFPAAMARLPVLARFVSEFGAQAVPESAAFMRADRWPDLDWDELTTRYCLQKDVFDARVPPADYPGFDEWRQASQHYQATVLRHHIETLRRLKYHPTGGFCLFLLADAQPAVSWAIVDHDRVPKAAYRAVSEACAPVIVVADRPDESYRPGDRLNLELHAVSDLRHPIEGAVTDVTLAWPGGLCRWRFAGDVDADRCVRIGRISTTLPRDAGAGPMTLELTMRWADGQALNRYVSRVDL